MRILHVETGRHLYGGALQVRYLLEGLSRMGVECHLAAPPGSAISKAAASICTVHETQTFGDLDLFFGTRLISLIRRLQPDILHIHSRRGADLWGAVAAIVTSVPAVVTRRVDNPEPKTISRLKYRAFHQVIAISQKIADLLDSQGVDARKITVIRSAVDETRFSGPCSRDRFIREFHLDDRQPVIGVIAQLIERKGHRDLIEAIPGIAARHPEVRFLFFGKGPEEKALKDLCRSRGVHSRVTFAGFREDLEEILPCLTLVVHPAKMEGLGVALLQASATGIPIVACNAGGIPEVVEDGCSGILIPPGDPDALAEAVSRILGDPDLGKRLGKYGREHVTRRFSIGRMVNENMEVYRRIAEKRSL